MSEYITDEHGNVLGSIVRCRDCKFYEEPNDITSTCSLDAEDTGLCSIVYADGFCAWGEKAVG